jgi:hypothetical protein
MLTDPRTLVLGAGVRRRRVAAKWLAAEGRAADGGVSGPSAA